MTMTLDELTAEEKAKIHDLRSRVRHLLTEKLIADESLYKRFLRARNFDVDAAETMLKNNIEWRKVNKIDKIITDYTPHEVARYCVIDLIGCDKEGSPMYYCPFGKLDTRGILKVVSKNDLLSFMLQHFEQHTELLKDQSKKLNKPIEQFTYIFNYENFSLSTATHKPTLEFLASLITTFDANYPERLKAGYIVNSSFVFTLFWAVLRPFLSENTYRKIKIFGKDGWKEDLLKIADADVLPVFLGGERTGPGGDPYCQDIIRPGQQVPEHYFPKKNSSRIPNSKKLVVHRMAKEEIELQVDHPGSIIEWEFFTKSRDIGFSLLFRGKDTGTKELIPRQRIETDVSSDARAFRCEKPGIYVIEFNNTYSWIHAKEVYYTAKVVSPKEQKMSL